MRNRMMKEENTATNNKGSVVWRGLFTLKPYCTCGQKLDYSDKSSHDNYCRKCGVMIDWIFPKGF